MGKPLGKARVLALLDEGMSFTALEAAALAFVSEKTAGRVLAELHVEHDVFIVDWSRNDGSARGKHVPVYSKGSSKDVHPPPPLSHYDKRRRYLQRKRLSSSIVPRDRIGERLMRWAGPGVE